MNPDIFADKDSPQWYRRVIHLFHFNEKQDRIARDYLFQQRNSFDPTELLRELEYALSSYYPLFFGAGPSFRSQLEQIAKILQTNRSKFYIIAADGAARGLALYDLYPDLIMTDLDGLSPERLELFLSSGVMLAIHGHGDNIEKLQAIESLLQQSSRIIATTQVKPHFPIINPGGFTDGDRGLYLCHHLAPSDKPFFLFGYDFGSEIGEFSKESFESNLPMTPQKHLKMQLCHQLIETLKIKKRRAILFFGRSPEIDQNILRIIGEEM